MNELSIMKKRKATADNAREGAVVNEIQVEVKDGKVVAVGNNEVLLEFSQEAQSIKGSIIENKGY